MLTEQLVVKGDVDAEAIEQIERCMSEHAIAGAVMADGHVGYSLCIGGVVAYPDHVSPSGVGYDIGCGNKAVKTDILASGLHRSEVAKIMDEIERRIDFGVHPGHEKPEHPVLERIARAEMRDLARMVQKAQSQLGTVGGGNHYVDLFEDEDGWLWVGVHFGSRGFGHKTATGFLNLHHGLNFDGTVKSGPGAGKKRGKKPREDMMAAPTLFEVNSDIGQAYIEAMTLAGEYAYAGRDVVTQTVLDILGAMAVDQVHNHHNYAWLEPHLGVNAWVVRKGATPAFPGQRGFVGATMGETSVILEGTDDPEAESLLNSTVHGAGRAMSRTRAAGKVKRFNVWECNDRDCDYRAPRDRELPGGEKVPCPRHPDGKLLKRTVVERVSDGEINYGEVRAELDRRGIELRGGAADEAPLAYKRLDEVLAAQGNTVRVLHRLRPIGVCMAAPEIPADD